MRDEQPGDRRSGPIGVRTVLLSVAAHGAVIALLAGRTATVDRRPVATAPRIELVDITPRPRVLADTVAVDVISLAAAPAVDHADRPQRARAPATARSVTTAPGTSPSLTATTGRSDDGTWRPSNALAMRGQRHDLALSDEVAARIAGSGGGTGQGEPETSSGEARWAHDPKIALAPSGNGSHVVRDPVAKFHVARDGSVTMKSKPHFTFRFKLPTPSTIKAELDEAGRDLVAWVADPYRDTRVGRPQDLPQHLQAVPGACDVPDSPMCFTAADQAKAWAREDKDLSTGSRDAAGGRADLTGYLGNKLVGDQY
ncbi:MAG TPA: hypothetical protein VM052_03385, partial [Candidatus Limnocylindrales bacterium]|nr:hypothetical protein [Candidatus Limnocylindrales bacterium]